MCRSVPATAARTAAKLASAHFSGVLQQIQDRDKVTGEDSSDDDDGGEDSQKP